ncbi:hypothetical protein [Chroococcidiopsis sp. CCALA 051]|uniref:hypothetical protein n=1 Tax=Chroococcidiopsis sp. CCALA 051 TaxID=869949 RepID=UPI001E622424|nr:hypothetical protein [Chroococcidiopsis sp. CCALA 051]
MMNESNDLNSLINQQQIEIDRITIPAKNLTLTEQFCVDFLGGKDVFRTSNRLAPEKQQSIPYFPVAIANSPRLNLCLQVWELPIVAQQKTTNTANISLNFFHQRWEQEIYNRFREARRRFPEFFPCFEIKENPITGLQYSIYFKPLTKYAQKLACNAPLFPYQEEFKPIEQLWNENGQSELELIFNRFPTQSALKPPQPAWRSGWGKFFLGLINQGRELIHVKGLLTQKNA